MDQDFIKNKIVNHIKEAEIVPDAPKAVKRERVKSVSKLLQVANQVLEGVPEFKVQYVEIRSLPDLEEIEMIEGRAAIAIAGYLGNTRLIDNMLLGE
jgi:pantothenate synthetase